MATILQTKRLGWALIFLLVTTVGLLSYFSGKRYVAAMAAVEHTLTVKSAIGEVLSVLKDAETGQRGYILSGDLPFLEPYDAALRDIPRHLQTLQQAVAGDAAQLTAVLRVRGLTEQKLAFIAETIELRRRGELVQALQLVRSGRGKQLMDEIRAQCGLMLEHEEQLLRKRKSDASAAERKAAWGVGVGSVLTVLLAFISFLTVQRDVNELRRTAEELASSEEHYRFLTEQSSDLVRLVSMTGVTVYVSPSVEPLLGYTVPEYLALEPMALVHPSELELARSPLEQARSTGSDVGGLTQRLRHKSGEYRWFDVRWAVRRDGLGAAQDLHSVARDITVQRAAEEQLNAQAEKLRGLSLRDELTGLYNRRGFLEAAAQAHARAKDDARPAALIFVDLNGMKRINDELGHEAGDHALIDAAQVLTRALRRSDVLARLGGDEFVVFALDFSSRDLDPLRARLRQLADARILEVSRPFRLSLSVGAAYAHDDYAASLSDLLEAADAAMSQQKRARRAAGGVSVPPPAPSS